MCGCVLCRRHIKYLLHRAKPHIMQGEVALWIKNTIRCLNSTKNTSMHQSIQNLNHIIRPSNFLIQIQK